VEHSKRSSSSTHYPLLREKPKEEKEDQEETMLPARRVARAVVVRIAAVGIVGVLAI
jgi:hypothetical protein